MEEVERLAAAVDRFTGLVRERSSTEAPIQLKRQLKAKLARGVEQNG
jgi:hypothetical protein